MATIRQRKAVQLLLKNKTASYGKVMREAGYSVSSAHTPQVLTNSKAYKEVFIKRLDEAGFTDEAIAKTMGKALKAKRPVLIGGGKVKQFPDWQARHAFIRTGLQAKKYLSDGADVPFNDSPLIVNAIQFKTEIKKEPIANN